MDNSRVFNLSADHVALDFVNTLDDRFVPDGKIEQLESYSDLLAFAGQAKLLSSAQVSSLLRLSRKEQPDRVLRCSITLRETLARIFYAVASGQRISPDDLSELNKAVIQASGHRVLVEQKGNFAWEWEGLDKTLEAPLWPLLQQAADLLTSPNLKFVRECGSESCRWLFLDVSKNHSRRWCDMKVCGNRVKARRYYALHGRE